MKEQKESIFSALTKVIVYRHIILSLAIYGFRSRFIGTGGGLLWGVLLPVTTVFSYWMVFSLGFKVTGPNGIPFDIYFMTGFLAWSLFAEILNACTGTIIGNRHLVKKMVFPTEVLPVVEIIIASISHLILLALTVILILMHGLPLSLWAAQLPYAYICIFIISLGFGWALSSINVFHRDVGQFTGVLLNFWFWATPIVWSVNMLPQQWQWIVKFNPFFYVIESYRNSLIFNQSVMADRTGFLIFWLMAIGIFFSGLYFFYKLKPEFADAL